MPRHPNFIPPKTPIVVKLGGSLHSHVPDIIGILSYSPRPLLIVPGGGKFADAVRELDITDDDAHWSAIRAMDQYGAHIAKFGFETTDQLSIPKRSAILLPYRCIRHLDPLAHTWDVTSDTIAAWVAGRLGLELLVLKSVDGIRINGELAGTISQRVETDVVDPCFIAYVLQHRIRTTIINGTALDLVADFLRGEQISCTRIGTTF
jgi:aspartokinase-like uncharacterized kinase